MKGMDIVILPVERWGNVPAIRLPKPFCEVLGIGVGDDVRVSMEEDRRIIIEPVREKYTLKDRMRSWNGERYRSSELSWSDAAGEELW